MFRIWPNCRGDCDTLAGGWQGSPTGRDNQSLLTSPMGGYRPTVDLRWGEKALLLLLFLQQYAVLWGMSKPWPWPGAWETWSRSARPTIPGCVLAGLTSPPSSPSRWTLAFNVDVIALSTYHQSGSFVLQTSTRHVSPYGERTNYWAYALPWAVTACAVAITPFIAYAVLYWRASPRLADVLARMVDACLLGGIVLYTPVCMALCRLYGAWPFCSCGIWRSLWVMPRGAEGAVGVREASPALMVPLSPFSRSLRA